MANRNWTRWVHASVASYLKQVCDVEGIVSLVEGIEDRTESFSVADDSIEIRVNGPFTFNPSASYEYGRVFINCLVTSRMGGQRKNKYQGDLNVGIMHEALDTEIPIMKCGNLPGDDDTCVIGCLRVLNEQKLGVRVNHFGQIDPTDRVKQYMVNAAYRIEFEDV